MSTFAVTAKQSSRLPWRRWLGAWALSTLWLGLFPVLVVTAYYGFTKPSDFAPTLQLLRAGGLVWAVRVGSASCSNIGIGVQNSSFGVNAENPGFKEGRSGVWNGNLHGTYQATYLAWFRSAHWPAVFTLFRSVRTNGEISFGAWQNGSKPIANYLLYCVLFGVVAVVFFEVVRVLDKRKKARTAS